MFFLYCFINGKLCFASHLDSRSWKPLEWLRKLSEMIWWETPTRKIWLEPIDSDSQCRKLSISETLGMFQLVWSSVKENRQLIVREWDHQRIPWTVQKVSNSLLFFIYLDCSLFTSCARCFARKKSFNPCLSSPTTYSYF